MEVAIKIKIKIGHIYTKKISVFINYYQQKLQKTKK